MTVNFRNLPFSFNSVSIYDDMALFTGSINSEKGILLIYDGEEWEYTELEAPTIGVAVSEIPEPCPVVLYFEYRAVGRYIPEKEAIVTEGLLESDNDYIWTPDEIRTIGKHAYVTGMHRSVFRCDGVDKWVRIDRDVFTYTVMAREEIIKRPYGFKSIHGFSEDDIYAVGYEGEIWHYNGQSWRPISSITNVLLHSVLCAPDGYVYISGELGMLLRGRNDAWKCLHKESGCEFQSIAWFRDQLYVGMIRSSGRGALYKLENDELETVISMPIQFMDASNEVMWVGNLRSLRYTHDGENWQEPDYSLPGLEEFN